MKNISILGDSLSTFYSEDAALTSYYHGDNEFYYPRYSQTIKTVEKTWWFQVIENNEYGPAQVKNPATTCAKMKNTNQK